MSRNKITPVTDREINAIINNSVQGAGSRLVGSAAEQKKLFVRPIANTDGTPNVASLIQRLAKETESAVGQLEKEVDALETPPPPDSLPLMGVFLTYDEDNETLQIVGEKGVSEDEVAGIVSEEVAPKLSEVEDKLSDKQDALAIADNYNAETNKVATEQTIATEIAKIIGGADTSFDTLKEIADWIIAHPNSVAEINAKIQANAEKISTNETAIANLDTLSKLLETNKQDKTDESLETESKQVVGAINEVNSGLVKGIDSSITEETNELVLELKGKDGTVLFSTKVQLPKSELPDLSAYVKNTDYAKGTEAGIVRRSYGNYGGITINTKPGEEGVLMISRALNSTIDNRTPNDYKDGATMDENRCLPICSANLDHAVIAVLTDCKLTLTDGQKAKARALLGIE